MGAPMIEGKVAIVVIGMTVAMAIGLMLMVGDRVEKCEDAGGVFVSNVCVNPAAIIELK
mgnify:CR=1 FL=1